MTQLGITLLLAVAALLAGQKYAISSLAGGVAATVADGAAAALVFRRYKASATTALMGRFYAAELARLVLTAVCFVTAALWLRQLSIGVMLGAYLLIRLSAVALLSIMGGSPKQRPGLEKNQGSSE